jgi:hypothetical protein
MLRAAQVAADRTDKSLLVAQVRWIVRWIVCLMDSAFSAFVMLLFSAFVMLLFSAFVMLLVTFLYLRDTCCSRLCILFDCCTAHDLKSVFQDHIKANADRLLWRRGISQAQLEQTKAMERWKRYCDW